MKKKLHAKQNLLKDPRAMIRNLEFIQDVTESCGHSTPEEGTFLPSLIHSVNTRDQLFSWHS